MNGGDGADTVNGGKGDDTLIGGTGADEFHFKPDTSSDVIQDFEDDIDTIVLTNTGLSNAAEALGLASQQGSDVVFDFGGGSTLTVQNVTLADLADDLMVL